ncbi:hypothetical protein RJ640_010611 [Escallonia rubra]|uniref:NPH3 domain-containing protein n=1 Tax=Escallonia rubra TaxID=112253 RepID=A0AA88RE49_9ASTE|nr:hypothetical protein RJ640_010611 [Escallonia rubra]
MGPQPPPPSLVTASVPSFSGAATNSSFWGNISSLRSSIGRIAAELDRRREALRLCCCDGEERPDGLAFRKLSSLTIPSENEQRKLIETVIANLPQEKTSRSSMATRILFGLLRTTKILNASEECKAALEKKIGSQLEQATLDDLLIPSYSYLNETLYDVDSVERILGYFLDGFEVRSASKIEGEDENSGVRSAALMLVGKLIDGYLSEIASDANLKPEKFYKLVVALPDHARLFNDDVPHPTGCQEDGAIEN